MEYKKELMKKIARQVKEYRIGNGMTQAKFAEVVGTVQPSIARLERGDGNVGINLLVKIHEKTGLELVLSLNE